MKITRVPEITLNSALVIKTELVADINSGKIVELIWAKAELTSNAKTMKDDFISDGYFTKRQSKTQASNFQKQPLSNSGTQTIDVAL